MPVFRESKSSVRVSGRCFQMILVNLDCSFVLFETVKVGHCGCGPLAMTETLGRTKGSHRGEQGIRNDLDSSCELCSKHTNR